MNLWGNNGVGKTSLLRLVCGLSALEEGEIHWKDQAVGKDLQAFRADLAYLGHQLALKDDLSPLENLRTDAAIAGRQPTLPHPINAFAQIGLTGRENLPGRGLSESTKVSTPSSAVVCDWG